MSTAASDPLTYYGIVNEFGHLSDVYAYKRFVMGALSVRADADRCKLVELKITITKEIPPEHRRK